MAGSEDKKAILQHIHHIFDAYLSKDSETIRALHTEDWVGLLAGSQRIERGIEDYMKHAHRSLEQYHGTGYEILDSEVLLNGDSAVVFYIAQYEYRDAEGNASKLPLRSVDLYRRESHGWNQWGSHITVIPDVPEDQWGPTVQK